ncbi:MAG: hypothetical protein AVDCRST_MAG73-1187, partial [uncultured Thermomicrobiales bacterium]
MDEGAFTLGVAADDEVVVQDNPNDDCPAGTISLKIEGRDLWASLRNGTVTFFFDANGNHTTDPERAVLNYRHGYRNQGWWKRA